MHNIYAIDLYVEDRGHEFFLNALVSRFVKDYGLAIEITFRNSRSGHGKVIHTLKDFISDMADEANPPDLLIAATDGNCKGFLKRKQEIEAVLKDYHRPVIYAIPDPHIERWFLLDSAAFKKVFGKSCAAPAQKCQRDLYKQKLREAVRAADKDPPFGGIEYAEALVSAMNLGKFERSEPSLGYLLKNLRLQFQAWQQEEQVQQ